MLLSAAQEERNRLQATLEKTVRDRDALQNDYNELRQALNKSRADALALRGKVEQLEASVRLRDAGVRARDWQIEQQREKARQILAVLRQAFGLAEAITAPVQAEAAEDDAGCCASCGAILPEGEEHKPDCQRP